MGSRWPAEVQTEHQTLKQMVWVCQKLLICWDFPNNHLQDSQRITRENSEQQLPEVRGKLQVRLLIGRQQELRKALVTIKMCRRGSLTAEHAEPRAAEGLQQQKTTAGAAQRGAETEATVHTHSATLETEDSKTWSGQSLDFSCYIWMVGSEFGVKLQLHPGLCQCVRLLLVWRRFSWLTFQTSWASFKPHSLSECCSWPGPPLHDHSVRPAG